MLRDPIIRVPSFSNRGALAPGIGPGPPPLTSKYRRWLRGASEILFWDHELELANRALTRVTASFEAFVEQLREAPLVTVEPAAGAVHTQDSEAFRQLKELERLEAAQPSVSWPPP